jgi:hypothetical protein
MGLKRLKLPPHYAKANIHKTWALRSVRVSVVRGSGLTIPTSRQSVSTRHTYLLRSRLLLVCSSCVERAGLTRCGVLEIGRTSDNGRPAGSDIEDQAWCRRDLVARTEDRFTREFFGAPR